MLFAGCVYGVGGEGGGGERKKKKSHVSVWEELGGMRGVVSGPGMIGMIKIASYCNSEDSRWESGQLDIGNGRQYLLFLIKPASE